MRLFTEGAPLPDHTALLSSDANEYLTAFNHTITAKLPMTPATKARVIAAMWLCQRRDELDALFAQDGFLLPADVLRAIRLLDSAREARALTRKIEKLESLEHVRPRTLKRIKLRLNELTQEGTGMAQGSASRAFLARVKKWVREIPRDRLEFFLLNFDTAPWKALCDLAHTKPSDFQLDYFQSYVFGGEAPEGTLVHATHTMNKDNLAALLQRYEFLPQCYSVIRKKVDPKHMDTATRALLAEHAPLEDVIWFYEEIACKQADKALAARLKHGEVIEAVRGRSNYGKLMERLLVFRGLKASFTKFLMPYAHDRLRDMAAMSEELNLGGLRCVVLGDASSSMSVAVKTATILGSLLSVLLNAELRFFNGGTFEVKAPRDVGGVLDTAETVRASGCTSPAAALLPFYKNRQPVDLFIVVTDEEENTAAGGLMFAPMFAKYKAEVNANAGLFFVSFLRENDPGVMVQALRRLGLTAPQFRMDGRRPDLTKFDSLLATLSVCAQSLRGETSTAA